MIESSVVEVEEVQERAALMNWQIEEIRKALAEADRKEFASNAELRQVVRKSTRPAR